MRMDAFFEEKEKKKKEIILVATTSTAATPTATIRCDDCNRWVPAEEVKVWLAPVAVESYEGEQDPVYMCKRCIKTFLNDNNNEEYHFEDLLYTIRDAARKYTPQILESWK